MNKILPAGARGLPLKTRNNLPIWSEFNQLSLKYNSFNLCHGTPGIEPPDFLTNALFEAVKTKNNQYTHFTGHPLLRESIARNFAKPLGRESINPNSEVIVTNGAS